MKNDVLYLSRAAVSSLWPSLDLTKRERLSLRELEAKAAISLSPGVDLTGKWSAAKHQAAPPSADQAPWPPWNADVIVQAINQFVSDGARLGSGADLAAGSKKFDYFVAEGLLSLPPGTNALHGLNSHVFDAHLQLEGSVFLCALASENLYGVRWDDDRWRIRNSLAYVMFRQMSEDRGLRVRALLTTAGSAAGFSGRVRAVYMQQTGWR
jgi:hypothetical protein